MDKDLMIKLALDAGGGIGTSTGKLFLTQEQLERFAVLAYAAGQREMKERARLICKAEKENWMATGETLSAIGAGLVLTDAIAKLAINGEAT